MAWTDSLISVWKLDEASGNAVDSYGSNTLTDTASVGSGTGLVYATARDFESGSAQYFTINDNASLSWGDINATIALYYKPESVAGAIISKDNVGASREFSLDIAGSSQFRLFMWSGASGSGGHSVLSAASSATNGAWHLVIFWHETDTDSINIKVDNATTVSTGHTGGVYDGTAKFQIGGRDDGGAYTADGLLGPVYFWKRLLTTQEMTDLYNSGSGLAYPFPSSGGAATLSGRAFDLGTIFGGSAIRC